MEVIVLLAARCFAMEREKRAKLSERRDLDPEAERVIEMMFRE